MRRDWVKSCSHNERTNEILVWHNVQEGNYGPIGSYVVSIPYPKSTEVVTRIDENTFSNSQGKIFRRIENTNNFQEIKRALDQIEL